MSALFDPTRVGRVGGDLRIALADTLRHAGDVTLLLAGGRRRWTDALASEVRSHLAGCLNAVELAIGLQLADGWLAQPVETLGAGYCRAAIERHAGLLSSELVGHLRRRAAAALHLRLTSTTPPLPPEDDAAELLLVSNGAVADAILAYRLSTDPWLSVHPLDRSMRADLPAEMLFDLVWTVAALLIDGVSRHMGMEDATVRPAIARAAAAVIGRHDEQSGPFARADYVATLVNSSDEAASIAQDAAMRRELLLLAAFAGRSADLPSELVLDLFIDGPVEDVTALCRLAGLSEEAYLSVIEGLQPVRDDVDGESLPQLVTSYRALTVDSAKAHLAPWRGPDPLIDKLARLDRSAA